MCLCITLPSSNSVLFTVMSIDRDWIDSPWRGNPQHRYRRGFSKAPASWCLYRGVSVSVRFSNAPFVNTGLLHTGSGSSILFWVDIMGSSKEHVSTEAIKCASVWWTQQAPVSYSITSALNHPLKMLSGLCVLMTSPPGLSDSLQERQCARMHSVTLSCTDLCCYPLMQSN